MAPQLLAWRANDGGRYLSAYQRFWRCVHHPVAISNFFDNVKRCEYGCDAAELRWHDHGTHRSPLAIWSEKPC